MTLILPQVIPIAHTHVLMNFHHVSLATMKFIFSGTVAGLNLPRSAEPFHYDEPLINTRRFKSQQFFCNRMLPEMFPQINFISLSYFWLASQFSLWRCEIG
jgi:hypothetical protein